MAVKKRGNRKENGNFRCRVTPIKLKENESKVERRKLSAIVASSSHLLCHLICNGDLCEYVTTNRRRSIDGEAGSEPDVQPARGDRSHTPPYRYSARQSSSAQRRPPRQPPPPSTIADRRRSPARIDGTVWQYLKNIYDFFTVGFQTENRLAVLENSPDNGVSNLLRMILVPILLAVIGVMMIPLVRELGLQTFAAIFYNQKMPENRQATLKRVSVGVSLVFDHMIKKIFPIVRLRWLHNNLFKRRAERASMPIPSTNQR